VNMGRTPPVPWVLVATVLVANLVTAQTLGSRQVRVEIDFRDSAIERSDDAQGTARVVIREPGSVGARGGVRGDSRTSRVTRSSGIFTIVQDGGDSQLRVATRVPYEDVDFYRSYATGAGYVARTVVFQDVGTFLKVHADVLPDRRIRLHLVPSVSYFSADGSGAIDFTDAATEIVAESGKPITIGGGTSRSDVLTRRILGYGARSAESESSIVLTAVLQ